MCAGNMCIRTILYSFIFSFPLSLYIYIYIYRDMIIYRYIHILFT